MGRAELLRVFRELAADFARTVPSRARDEAKAQYALELGTVGEMHRAGIGLLAGTDVGSLPPGRSLHEELALLVQAGLPPMDALRAATTNPALALQLDNVGRIEPGAVADLVLLDADPLADIRNTEQIHAVFAAGRLFERGALDQLLAERVAANAAAWEALA